MTVLTERDVTTELQALEYRLARGRRAAVLLTVIPAVVAITLIVSAAVIVSRASNAVRRYEQRANDAAREVAKKQVEVEGLQADATKAREALDASRRASQAIAINLFHRGEHARAIKAYDEALQYDPRNAYVLNLKGYAQFKMNDIDSAENTLEHAVEIDPAYAWSYFDLARVRCAQGDLTNARSAALSALQHSPGIRSQMVSDGEFLRLCRPLLRDLGIE
jgi:tetratricopeptide (TPR) repeat protein